MDTTALAERLEACPFCNAKVAVVSNRDWHRIQGKHTQDCPLADYEFATPATDDDLASAIAAWNRRAVAGEPASDVKWIRLRGSQGEPAGRMIVTAEMEDGREIELIRDGQNEIDHSVRLASVIATPNPEQPARAKGG